MHTKFDKKASIDDEYMVESIGHAASDILNLSFSKSTFLNIYDIIEGCIKECLVYLQDNDNE